ncbi:MAG TPA: hypothetical protein VGV85_14755 [Longimicrobiaceae bacterium]|nr:hypothetical protein [Longimicrobiaceae bacterium]
MEPSAEIPAGPAMSGVPVDVQRFVAANIDSAEHREVLPLLHRHPDRGWRTHDVSREIFWRAWWSWGS